MEILPRDFPFKCDVNSHEFLVLDFDFGWFGGGKVLHDEINVVTRLGLKQAFFEYLEQRER